ILDVRRSVSVVVEELLLARVEHEPADHDVDPDERDPIRDAVEDRALADEGVWAVRALDRHRTLLSALPVGGRSQKHHRNTSTVCSLLQATRCRIARRRFSAPRSFAARTSSSYSTRASPRRPTCTWRGGTSIR